MGATWSKLYGAFLGCCLGRAPLSYRDNLRDQHIRLLQFVRPRWYTLGLLAPRLILTTHALDQLPKFVALSYTWGNPQDTEGDALETYNDKFPVRVNKTNAMILRNLRDALGSLLWLWNFDDDVQHMWIDAVCINQHDLAERGAQVGIMDEIYKRAETTVVWLGKPTKNSRKATRMFETICRIPSKELMPYYREYPNGTPPPAEFWFQRGLPTSDDADAWRPLTEFFKHSWFSRAWIIQEVTLSTRNIHLFWGHHSMTWEQMGHVSFVCQVAMIGKLETLPTLSRFLSGQQIPEEGQDWVVSDPLVNSFQLWSNRQRYLQRSQDTLNDTMRNEMMTLTGCTDPSATSWLLYFALINRRADATDPRDKIFCNLGLVNNIAKQEGLETCKIKAAYSSDTTFSQIYQQTVVDAIKETDSLAVLMALNDPPRLRKDHLPRWVPDFSRKQGLDLMWSIRPQFDASRNENPSEQVHLGSRRVKIDGPSLHVQCTIIGSVKTLSASLADLVGPNWCRWAEELMQAEPTYSYTGEGRVEAFWRTLLMNSVARQYPAQWAGIEDSGEMFRAYMLQSMARHFPGPGSNVSLEDYQHQLRHINELSATDPAGHMPSFKGLRSLTSQITGVPEEGLESLSEHSIITALTASADKASRFLMGMDGSMVNRRLVISDGGHFVNAPLWAEVTDKIAIIDGCPCPVLVRAQHEQGLYCILVGTAYVHGAMYGEAVGSNPQWENLCIR